MIDQMVYINNRVLIPRLEYRLTTTLLSEDQARVVYTPITKAAKRAMGLASSTQTNIIAHSGIGGFTTLMQNQISHHFTELTLRLNDSTCAQDTTKIRLRQLQ